ncbi:MAG: BNR repeat-containing protein [Planctomycetales bacterium]|nr:BNR repeat-containing protein [Planctomycetales bacterium]
MKTSQRFFLFQGDEARLKLVHGILGSRATFAFKSFLAVVFMVLPFRVLGQETYPIGLGWARTKVNTVIFRHHAVCTFGQIQVAAYYDQDGRVVLAHRTLDSSKWDLHITPYRGRTEDAHNSISIAFDGKGRLHMSWNHHGSSLNYCRATAPGSIELGPKESIVGNFEDRVTYPEFVNLPSGDLLLFYRSGGSGDGNLVLDFYNAQTESWHRLHDNLIDGEGQRNAYWQVACGKTGHLHLSWVWRETPDVITNHDICYAVSKDSGRTWQTTDGRRYELPINQDTAEYAVRIPQDSELANQTSMAVDADDHPVIANFWRTDGESVPQYRLVLFDGERWRVQQIGTRTLDFHRQGGGTKSPPVSRPLVLINSDTQPSPTYVLFRDLELGGGITVARATDPLANNWTFEQLTPGPVGQSDPLVDVSLWNSQRKIHLFSQYAGQGDYETQVEVEPQMVSVIEWRPQANPPR